MVGLTASLLLIVPLLQLLSLAASIKSYVMFYQRAGSIWAFVVREAKVVPRTCRQLGYFGVPSKVTPCGHRPWSPLAHPLSPTGFQTD
jgi:hypothetical protein